MTAVRIDGKALAATVRAQVAQDVKAFGEPVCLATILVGDDSASHVYVGSKHKASHEAGIDSRDHRFPAETPETEILDLIAELNADDDVDGILVQLPLPEHMDEPKVLRSVDPAKDVDGFHPSNAGLLFLGEPFLVPATPSGVMVMLAEHGVELEGKEAVVIGRSEIVGKPMAMLLLAEHATVTICHSRTANLAEHTRRADVLVAAVGRPRIVTPEMVKPGATVIDVGVNRTEAGLVGDVDPAVFEVAGLMTPVPGGVGPMTIAMLLRNTLTAAQHRRSKVALPGS
ncbi:MAG: bifunctional 5,10-methylenetetrahydrofolate dehydrogenase/5,10-methenyltetrahydrofolate cyclohydrolase [Thermoleophilia bacterium]|nr:bifunctional 5,10-methylenetetrahydrofolate dehydrogenase/5,10-methenyltetrahydrofolate cyclohydrolase [Thermoleophilia bacterium]MDH5280815.1 bifunctional 5,10-methylenetetrahydrofolate dehydrogenase/5,10-methenyltetrahydrofolate cyclohydrolase [Thermoleophilia bacterium]